MMTEDAMLDLIREIMQQGFDRQTAGRYAVLIGDTPVVDNAGNIVVMDGSQLIASLKPLAIFR